MKPSIRHAPLAAAVLLLAASRVTASPSLAVPRLVSSATSDPVRVSGLSLVPPQCAHLSFAHTIHGTPENDHITGTNQNDLIFALGGDDDIDGKNGQDCIVGGDGDDKISGGNAKDFLVGGPGDDEVDGDNGKDYIDGGPGTDTCSGNRAPDSVSCENTSPAAKFAAAGTPPPSNEEDEPSPTPGASATPEPPRTRGSHSGTRTDTSSAGGRPFVVPARTPSPTPTEEPPLAPSTPPTPGTFHHTRGNEAGMPSSEPKNVVGGYRKR